LTDTSERWVVLPTDFWNAVAIVEARHVDKHTLTSMLVMEHNSTPLPASWY